MTYYNVFYRNRRIAKTFSLRIAKRIEEMPFYHVQTIRRYIHSET